MHEGVGLLAGRIGLPCPNCPSSLDVVDQYQA
jgi:hypothetical protein